MAKQRKNPPQWSPEFSDGCSCPWFLKFTTRSLRQVCLNHDKRYHYGGSVEDKQTADDIFYEEGAITGPWYMPDWSIEWRARRMYWHIRAWTYNFPPGHVNRSEGDYIEAFNWEGRTKEMNNADTS